MSATDDPHPDPLTEAQVRALRVNDTVTLEGTLFGIRDANQIALFDQRTHHALRHARPRRHPHRAQRAEGDGRRPSIPPAMPRSASGTTTSARMERFTAPLLETLGVRLIVGKGGLGRLRWRRSGGWAAPTSPSSAGRPPWRPPGSRRSRTSTSTTCNPESLVEIPRAGLRPAARGDGQPRAAASTTPSISKARVPGSANALAQLGVK